MQPRTKLLKRSIPLTIAAGCVFLLAGFPQTKPLSAPLNPAQKQAGSLSSKVNVPAAPVYAWAPELLYVIISSRAPEALNSLYDAAFAAGPAIVPELQAALKDDRTAEFAAQTLAFIGGDAAWTTLSSLMSDRRNLDLSRFFYGALGELDTPQANAVLVNAVRSANNQPDRTVTEAAIIALTVGNRAQLVPELKQAQTALTDPVIQDDLENAISIIEVRAKYLATPAGKSAGGSLQQALNLYFEPALAASAPPLGAGARRRAPQSGSASQPPAQVEIQHVVFSSDRNRALARVLFDDHGVMAHYHVVLQKRYGDWTVASVWLNLGNQEASPETNPAPPHGQARAPKGAHP
ncbi:MAG: hypothetical protein ACRD06_03695 [Terriglobia bacterium]